MKLTDAAVRKAKPETKPYKKADGGGLYLFVQLNGAKYWRRKYRFGGKEKMLALGVYPDTTLAEARERREEARKLLANGSDLGAIKQIQKRQAKLSAANTFEAVACEWIENMANHWTEGHKALTLRTQDAFPTLGNRPIAEITPSELLATIRAIEKRDALEIAG